jgi:hypothetical protein
MRKDLGFIEEHGTDAWFDLSVEQKLLVCFEDFPDEMVRAAAELIEQACLWAPHGLLWPSRPGEGEVIGA